MGPTLLFFLLAPIGAVLLASVGWAQWRDYRTDRALLAGLRASLLARPGARARPEPAALAEVPTPGGRRATLRPDRPSTSSNTKETWTVQVTPVEGTVEVRVVPSLLSMMQIVEKPPLPVSGRDKALAAAVGEDPGFEAAVLRFSRARDAFTVELDGEGALSLRCDRRGFTPVDVDEVLALADGIADAYEAAAPRAQARVLEHERAARLALPPPEGSVGSASGAPVALGSTLKGRDG